MAVGWPWARTSSPCCWQPWGPPALAGGLQRHQLGPPPAAVMGCQAQLLGRSLSPSVAAGPPPKWAVWWDALAPPYSCWELRQVQGYGHWGGLGLGTCGATAVPSPQGACWLAFSTNKGAEHGAAGSG